VRLDGLRGFAGFALGGRFAHKGVCGIDPQIYAERSKKQDLNKVAYLGVGIAILGNPMKATSPGCLIPESKNQRDDSPDSSLGVSTNLNRSS
jgi:hypothetical protein